MKIEYVTSPQDKRAFLNSFDPATQTWIVADLKSKLEIQKILLERQPLLAEDSVLRASELWKKLLLRVKPECRLLGGDLCHVLIAQFLRTVDIPWAHTPGAAKTLIEYINQLLPVLIHPEGESLLVNWFVENPESQLRWGHWASLSFKAWAYLENSDWIISPWIKGLLATENLQQLWSRELIVDLGVELSPVEAEIFQSLDKNKTVQVLRPVASWSDRFRADFLAYELLEKNQEEKLPLEPQSNCEFYRFKTMVAEVKGAVAKIRSWLDAGVESENIVLAAPDIESYWPVLFRYLEQEGVPFAKKVMSRLQSFPAVQIWLSKLRISLGDVRSADLEISLYSREENKIIKYDRFYALFLNVYSVDDLDRDKALKALFEIEYESKNAMVGRDQFAAWALKRWGEEEIENIQRFFTLFFQECPVQLRLSLSDWMDYFERLAARIEITIQEGEASGVQILNIDSVEWVPTRNLIMIGLNDEALRKTERTGISHGDVWSLSQNLGFRLAYPDRLNQEWESRWLLLRTFDSLILSFSETDFDGTPQSPAMMWLEMAKLNGRDLEAVTIPERTRWDELQISDLNVICQAKEWNVQQAETVEQRILGDLGQNKIEPFAQNLPFHLSASSLEDYWSCPFVFAASKVFRLTDLPILDMDVDYRTRGQLMHAVFRQLTQTPMRFDWTDSELQALVEKCAADEEYLFGDVELAKSFFRRYVQMARGFLDFEKQWRQQFPATQTVGHELKVKARWHIKEKCLVPDTGEYVGPQLIGYVDRVDEGKNGIRVILDYKSQGTELTHYGSWLNSGSFQLPLYSQAVAAGCTELGAGPVDGAFYFVAKTFNRDKGFRIADSQSELFDLNAKTKNSLSTDELQQFYHELGEAVGGLVAAIAEGNFAPQPQNFNTCKSCQWRSLCRSPHLN